MKKYKTKKIGFIGCDPLVIPAHLLRLPECMFLTEFKGGSQDNQVGVKTKAKTEEKN